jgi:hypothetical protein
MVHLAAADEATLKDAIRSAWQHVAAGKPKRSAKKRA